MSVTKNVPDFTHHISLRWTTQRVDFPWTQMLDEQGNFVPLFDTEEERLCIYYLMHENIFFFCPATVGYTRYVEILSLML